MPTYQYTCTDCKTPLEAVQSFSDDALTVCPTCGGHLRKVYSAVGVVFKGSGFYKNDSRPRESSTSGGDAGGTKDSGTKDSGAKGGGAKDGGSSSGGAKDGGSGTTGGSGSSGSSATPKQAPAKAASSSGGTSAGT